jgi:hypothetical protein
MYYITIDIGAILTTIAIVAVIGLIARWWHDNYGGEKNYWRRRELERRWWWRWIVIPVVNVAGWLIIAAIVIHLRAWR